MLAQTQTKAALTLKDKQLKYIDLAENIKTFSNSLLAVNIERYDRVGIYLHKTFEAIISIFGASQSGAAFVPINSILKAPQVQHIINDCDIKVLITNKGRFKGLIPILTHLPKLESVILIDENQTEQQAIEHVKIFSWQKFEQLTSSSEVLPPKTASDMAAIFYTSGSTGKPKGVVLSHQNIVEGAKSVANYLENTSDDKILAVLPLSFDYGFSQITTSFLVGAECVLFDYLLPNDVLKAVNNYQITGLAAVPPLWSQLCNLNWPEDSGTSLRYFTNSGGALTQTNLATLRKNLPKASPYLMYGLTEAFRSTYLSPDEIDNRVGSMGKAIPNAEVLVARPDGSECDPEEPGELVHKGPLVALGYWNAPDKTAERFKAAPGQPNGIMVPELAVWSGDSVKKDKDGYLYFVARQDEMMKTSGYRVSPMEIEEILYEHQDVAEAACFGAPHTELGQAIVAVVCTNSDNCLEEIAKNITRHCQKTMANYMVPKKVIVLKEIPHNANGKIDRASISLIYKNIFTD